MIVRRLFVSLGLIGFFLAGLLQTQLTTGAQTVTPDMATVSALETQVSVLSTKVALQDQIASLNSQLTPSAGATPTTEAGQEGVIYQADWSNGLGDWKGSLDWQTISGLLVSNGENNDYQSSLLGGTQLEPSQSGVILAPDVLDGRTDYAVEAEIQFLGYEGDCNYFSFGLIARGMQQGDMFTGYMGGGGHYTPCASNPSRIGIWDLVDLIGPQNAMPDKLAVSSRESDWGSDWRTYRLEVQGNVVRLFIDGNLIAEQADNAYLQPGRVGVWSHGVELSVRNFKVLALPESQ